MKKFLALYYMGEEGGKKMMSSQPEDMKAEEKKWMDWFEKHSDNLVEQGEYFKQGTRTNSAGTEDCTGKVSGFSLLQADDFEAAQALLEDHPHTAFTDDCAIELYEPMDMGGK